MSWSKVDMQWVETPPTPAAQNHYTPLCDWKLAFTNPPAISRGENFSFTIEISRLYGPIQNITVRGQIEDIFGRIVETYQPWTSQLITSSNSRTYSPNLPEGTYSLSFWQVNQSCNDAAQLNNNASHVVAINQQYHQNNSFISIEKVNVGGDNIAKWGDSIETKLALYRGDSSSTSVTLWVEKGSKKISDTARITLSQQFKAYNLTVPLFIDLNCAEKYNSGTAQVVLEGLGMKDEQDISITEDRSDECDDLPEDSSSTSSLATARSVSFRIPSFPSMVTQPFFDFDVQINNGKDPAQYKVWSYLYKGRTCYSCQGDENLREANAQILNLDKSETQVIPFTLTIDDLAPEGNYSVKVKLLKEGQKTAKEWTGSVFYSPSNNQFQKSQFFNSPNLSLTQSNPFFTLANTQNNLGLAMPEGLPSPSHTSSLFNQSMGFVAYESNSRKASALIPAILIISLSLCVITLFWENVKRTTK